jgi:glycosyltransferase involved in cell wall biosynthesis
MISPWLLVAGDFTLLGGMDAANHALASHLAREAAGEVHLVAHRVDADLAALPAVRVHTALRPLGAHTLGEPMLRRLALRWQRELAFSGVRVIANGGNVDAGDVAWVHYVHAAYVPDAGSAAGRIRARAHHRRHVRAERDALRRARLLICNSRRTADEVVRLVGVPPERTRVVYYGTDSRRFSAVGPEEREAARRALGVSDSRRLALFVGALGDRRKGFDTVFEAWRLLCRDPLWDADMLVAGAGAELGSWRARASRELPPRRLRFTGFARDVPRLLAACDVLVHPARYEAYGLAVHEALCRGVPAIVSASAGVAERYPPELRRLLLADPEDASVLANQLREWRASTDLGAQAARFGAQLRQRTWDQMARDIAGAVAGLRSS